MFLLNCRKYKFRSIKHVEMKADPQKGKRYLLELVVQDLTDGKIYLLSEYVFLPNGMLPKWSAMGQESGCLLNTYSKEPGSMGSSFYKER